MDPVQKIVGEVKFNYDLFGGMTVAEEIRLKQVADAKNGEKLTEILDARQRLFAQVLPISVKMGIEHFSTSTGFRSDFVAIADAAAHVAWQRVQAWDSSKGITLGAWVAKTSGAEFYKERTAAELQEARPDGLAVAAIKNKVSDSYQKPIHTGYRMAQAISGEGFPYAEQARVEGGEELGINDAKTNTKATFVTKGLNKPRRYKRAKTGYRLDELSAIQNAFEGGISKLTSNAALKMVFSREPKRIMRHEVSVAMVFGELIEDRRKRQMNLGKQWTAEYVQKLMDSEAIVMSYDQEISNGEGAQSFKDSEVTGFIPTYLSDEDDESDEPEFSESTLAEGKSLAQVLDGIGMLAIAIEIPLDKFLRAYRKYQEDESKYTAFVRLCSRYQVRVKHAKQICEVVYNNFNDL